MYNSNKLIARAGIKMNESHDIWHGRERKIM